MTMNARTIPLGILCVALAVALLVPSCSDNTRSGGMHPDDALISALESVFLTRNLRNRPWTPLMSCGAEDIECQADWHGLRVCTHLHEAAKFARVAAPLVGTEPDVMADAADNCDDVIEGIRRGEEDMEAMRQVEMQVKRYVNGARRHAHRLQAPIPRYYDL